MTTLEIFGHNDIVEIISVIPGGLFEVTLSIWLIVSGFGKNRPDPSVPGASRTPSTTTSR
ncbi:MAG: hypothetical protein ACI9MC_001750 [Kiritimatiellia bacterium]|jgi:hypothetical protein